MSGRAIGLAVFAALALIPAADASAATGLVIKPNPVAFGGVSGNSSKTLQVFVFNEGAADAQPRIFITSGNAQFKIKEGSTVTCPRIHHGQRCIVHVTYHPSSASQDSGTIRAADKLRFNNRATAQLTGHRTVPHPPNCIMAMKRHQKIIKQIKKNGKKVLKRTPFALSLTQSQDGRVSAIASGKDDLGQAIGLEPADKSATAGNGVQLKLKLKKKSERRIIAEIKRNLVPQMTLTGTCQNSDGDARQVGAVIRFTDSKPGKPFGYPLIADATAK